MTGARGLLGLPEGDIYERSRSGRRGVTPPRPVDPSLLEEAKEGLPLRKEAPRLPEVGENEAVRHFTRLSQMNYAVDTGFYPLGSCTMKYNPRINEEMASLPGFAALHPATPPDLTQGILTLFGRLESYLCEITGMDRFSLQPAAGSQGELTGMLMVAAYFRARGEERKRVIVPDTAHGTNPATAAMAGFAVTEVPSDERGNMDLSALEKALDADVAALMLTNPNTLGLFDEHVLEIARMVHGKGALLYFDGANLNAILGRSRPGDAGFDIVHVNLHKTFSTPHGMGGPGSGPVGVKKELVPFLPRPLLVRDADGGYRWEEEGPQSIGRLRSYYGNAGILIRAYSYIRMLGPQGLREVSGDAVLNANYLLEKLRPLFDVPYRRRVMHELVVSGKSLREETGIRTMDVVKRLLDYGYHPPTVYFPLVVE
ncbi:MAG: aminomethyl-transferring glycine dehydrogenase subunit GcvPB, partial [Bacillota bacterium]|nr:aminomethyl-transferring glycine dehydrogenase subunit GcvPB [Bacillota bacterium]